MRRGRGVGAVARFKAQVREIRRARAKGELPPAPAQTPDYRPWWADKEDDDMTINGGQPHQVGYSGQPFKVTVHDADLDARRTVCWTKAPEAECVKMMRGLETRPGWTDAKYENVRNRKTGE